MIQKFDDFLNEAKADNIAATKMLRELWNKHLGAFMKEAIKLEKEKAIPGNFLYDKFLCSVFTDVPTSYKHYLDEFEKGENAKKTKK